MKKYIVLIGYKVNEANKINNSNYMTILTCEGRQILVCKDDIHASYKLEVSASKDKPQEDVCRFFVKPDATIYVASSGEELDLQLRGMLSASGGGTIQKYWDDGGTVSKSRDDMFCAGLDI